MRFCSWRHCPTIRRGLEKPLLPENFHLSDHSFNSRPETLAALTGFRDFPKAFQVVGRYLKSFRYRVHHFQFDRPVVLRCVTYELLEAALSKLQIE